MPRWVKLTNQTTPQDLLDNGMCVRVRVRVGGQTIDDVLAQIDPGASGSCVRPAFIYPLPVDPAGWKINPHFLDASRERVDFFRST